MIHNVVVDEARVFSRFIHYFVPIADVAIENQEVEGRKGKEVGEEGGEEDREIVQL